MGHPLTSATVNEYIDLSEAARSGFGSYSTLYRLARNGSISAIRIGHRIKVRRSDLDARVSPMSSETPTLPGIDAAVAEVVARSPELSDEQRHEILAALGEKRSS